MKSRQGGRPRARALVVVSLLAVACGGGKEETQQMNAAADSLTKQHDSVVTQLDSSKLPRQVDTTKLGAAKTESVLTAQRKKP